ncbi:mitochondrial ribosomal protein L21 [Volvox carteri f. nagariensis]|uniref:Large ribosomal subunit protein bL21m n=1 Tax=Volvox carteri f. nagariensis TaxID=3068 RepID=D8UC88_VOLCA|nr:mitochondrial ribosomal protein L21 [Volvox carteri f. nagariensis]EFJ42602.1 mitochondrial ribosomal protein L21 [Volvox carteri f. nagariensis]|eukprot:XP_002956253.1 mitochondrial ribosomal protein L21 [Volvox carteri f. nagariensis]
MAMRSALLQLSDSVGVGILGLNRSCWGASTSSSSPQEGWLGLRLLRTLADCNAYLHPQLQNILTTPTRQQHAVPGPCRWPLASGMVINVRGYKSNKRSLKPMNTAASWQAIQPLVMEQQQRQEVLGGTSKPHRRRWQPRLGPIVDTCLPAIPKVLIPAEYKRVGVIMGQYSLKPERTFGIVQLAGSQFKVTTDDIIFVNQLTDVEVNDVLALDRVMLLGSRAETIVGRPYIPGATVLAAVEEHFRDGKVHVFKKKRRKRYKKYQAPRANLTTLRILQIRGILPAPGDELAMVPELPIEPVQPQFAARLPAQLDVAAADDDGEGEEEEELQLQQQEVQRPPRDGAMDSRQMKSLGTVPLCCRVWLEKDGSVCICGRVRKQSKHMPLKGYYGNSGQNPPLMVIQR